MCDEGYYACNGSEDEVTKRCLAKGYFQDWTRVIPQRVTLGMGQGERLRLELRYIRVRPS